jgi:hypothetical protein
MLTNVDPTALAAGGVPRVALPKQPIGFIEKQSKLSKLLKAMAT